MGVVENSLLLYGREFVGRMLGNLSKFNELNNSGLGRAGQPWSLPCLEFMCLLSRALQSSDLATNNL